MDGTAIVVCDGFFATAQRKDRARAGARHGPVRILGVIDAPTAGRDAGEVLDGQPRGIPVFATIAEALARRERGPTSASSASRPRAGG